VSPRRPGPPPEPEPERSGDQFIGDLAKILGPAHQLRYEKAELFDSVATEHLINAARSLRAIAWSCIEGARKLERIVMLRERPGE
jgi:hypothetical protein